MAAINILIRSESLSNLLARHSSFHHPLINITCLELQSHHHHQNYNFRKQPSSSSSLLQANLKNFVSRSKIKRSSTRAILFRTISIDATQSKIIPFLKSKLVLVLFKMYEISLNLVTSQRLVKQYLHLKI